VEPETQKRKTNMSQVPAIEKRGRRKGKSKKGGSYQEEAKSSKKEISNNGDGITNRGKGRDP